MASLLFVMRYPLHTWDNLKNKFDGQLAAARALGHEVRWIGFSPDGLWLCGGEKPIRLKAAPLSRAPLYEHTALYIDLMAALQKAVSLQSFDVIYMRYGQTFGNAPGAIARAKRSGAKLIVEHPTYPIQNGLTTSLIRRPVFWYTSRVFRRIEPMIDLYALIGDPCGETLHGVPAMNIVNGVDVERFPTHASRAEGREVGLLALASMSAWQGYDRLIEALGRYRGAERVVLHMVGGEGDGSLAAWKRLASSLGLENSVVFHGEMYGDALDALVEECDIGIGGLGLYRKGQFCSMTLKLREYMARGLPFVYAVDDPSVPAEPRFCLRLANDDSPIDMCKVVDFALCARRDADAGREMRAYARTHMSWQGVLRGVLERVGIS